MQTCSQSDIQCLLSKILYPVNLVSGLLKRVGSFESIDCFFSNIFAYAQRLHSGLADFLQRALAAYIRVGQIAWSKLTDS